MRNFNYVNWVKKLVAISWKKIIDLIAIKKLVQNIFLFDKINLELFQYENKSSFYIFYERRNFKRIKFRHMHMFECVIEDNTKKDIRPEMEKSSCVPFPILTKTFLLKKIS